MSITYLLIIVILKLYRHNLVHNILKMIFDEPKPVCSTKISLFNHFKWNNKELLKYWPISL
mgnify:CR=1 FL=1